GVTQQAPAEGRTGFIGNGLTVQRLVNEGIQFRLGVDVFLTVRDEPLHVVEHRLGAGQRAALQVVYLHVVIHLPGGRGLGPVGDVRQVGWDDLNDRLAGQVVEDGRLRSEEHTSELQSRENLVCRLLLEKKNIYYRIDT